MILLVAAAIWLVAFILFSFYPRLNHETRRLAQLDLLAIGALGVATAGFFWRLLFTENVWMPAGGGDLAGFLFPTYQFAAQWLTRGVIPLWNPYIFAGTPFVGDIQTALFYPLNLLTYYISNPLQYRDLEYLAVLHFFIAGIGMYAFLRYSRFSESGHGLGIPAALAGAIAFEFSDLFIIHFGNLNLIAAAAWLPLIFLFFMLALDSQITKKQGSHSRVSGLRFAALAGLFLAISFFAGHIQPFLFIVLALALYTIYQIWLNRESWKIIALLLALTLGIAAGISAITLLPGLELARASVRTAFTYEDAAQFSLPPAELIGLLVPGFFGRGPQAAWGPWQRVEVGYIGVLPLILAAVALLLRRNSKTVFFGLLALVGLFLALGGYAIFQGWLFEFVPGFGELRAPARFILLLDFGLVVLAAVGFDALAQPLSAGELQRLKSIVRPAAIVAFVVAAVSLGVALTILILGQSQDPVLFERIANASNSLAFFILLLALALFLLYARVANRITPRQWALGALALISLDLFSLGAYVDIGISDPMAIYRRDDIIQAIQSQGELARIDSRTDVEGVWRADTGFIYGISDVNGDNPLVLEDFDKFWEALGSRDAPAYNLLNTGFVIAGRNTPLPTKFKRVFDGSGGISVYQNDHAFPKAWISYTSRVANDQTQALSWIKASDFDPRAEVILSGPGAGEHSDSSFPIDTAEVTGYGPNEIDAKVNARADGYLVLSEVFAPGWRAFVDDSEVPVLRADFLLRAVPVSVGAHTVRFVYDPVSFRIGALITGLTILLLVGVAIITWYNEKRASQRSLNYHASNT